MKEITADERIHYLAARNGDDSRLGWFLADHWRDTTAALMRSEFDREHDMYTDATGIGVYCSRCGRESNWDPRHLFKFEQWQAAADKYCRGED